MLRINFGRHTFVSGVLNSRGCSSTPQATPSKIATLDFVPLFSIILLLLSGCISQKLDLPVLKSINFEGNSALSDRQIKKGLASEETSIIPVLGDVSYFDEVKIEVAESSFRTLGLGGGLGVSTGRNEIRGRAQFTHTNFLGDLRRFEAELRPAYVFVPDFSKPERKGWAGQARVSLFQPDFLLDQNIHYLGLTTSFMGERDIQDAYSIDTGAARVGLLWPTNARSNFEIGYNLEAFALKNLPLDEQQCGRVCLLSFLDQKATLDKRDDRIRPRKGMLATLALQEAGLGGQFHYLRVLPEMRTYFPVLEDLNAVTRIQVGTLISKTGERSPIPKRFYAGGSASHRGFGLRRLAPQVPGKSGKRNVPVGGNSLLLGNLELRYLLLENFSLISFLDAGDVEREENTYVLQNLNYASGIGFRFDTAVVPIRLDVGYRINRPTRFRNEPLFAFHLNLGDSF